MTTPMSRINELEKTVERLQLSLDAVASAIGNPDVYLQRDTRGQYIVHTIPR